MTSSVRYALAGLASLALLAGCGDSDKAEKDLAEGDPALSGALEDQIMVDPELSGQNGAAADAGTGAIDLPPEQRSPEAITAAKQEAATLAGGSLQSAPAPEKGSAAALVENAATAAQIAASSKAAATDCANRVGYSMSWVTKLPAPLAVYPRGAVQEAAGTDTQECSLRVVSYVTPVAADDVMDFYFTTMRKAGFSANHKLEGGDKVLGGGKGGQAYVVYARALDNGLTEVDLISSGK